MKSMNDPNMINLQPMQELKPVGISPVPTASPDDAPC